MTIQKQMLDLVQLQTIAIAAQAIVAAFTVIVAVYLGRKQAREGRDIAREQNMLSKSLAIQQHEAAIELAGKQHEQTVGLMQAGWERGDAQIYASREDDRNSLFELFKDYVDSLNQLLHSARNPVFPDAHGLWNYPEGVVSLSVALERVIEGARAAQLSIRIVEVTMSKTVRGALAYDRIAAAIQSAATPQSGVQPSHPSVVKTWAEKVVDQFREAMWAV